MSDKTKAELWETIRDLQEKNRNLSALPAEVEELTRKLGELECENEDLYREKGRIEDRNKILAEEAAEATRVRTEIARFCEEEKEANERLREKLLKKDDELAQVEHAREELIEKNIDLAKRLSNVKESLEASRINSEFFRHERDLVVSLFEVALTGSKRGEGLDDREL